MADGNASRALLSAYRSSIMRFQKLLKTHVTEEEHDYIKERLSACKAAVKALIEACTSGDHSVFATVSPGRKKSDFLVAQRGNSPVGKGEDPCRLCIPLWAGG